MDLYALSTFTPLELEFMAENELVSIRPAVGNEQLQLLCGTFGPLTVGLNADVPLWLARTLKASGKAHIVTPGWMRARELSVRLEEEKAAPNAFSSLPFHFVEISAAILADAEDDLILDGEDPQVRCTARQWAPHSSSSSTLGTHHPRTHAPMPPHPVPRP